MKILSYISISILSFLFFTSASGQNLVWAKQASGEFSCEIRDALATSDGDLIATGKFSGVLDYNPGDGVTELTANNPEDQFVIRTTAEGDLIWIMQFDGRLPLDYTKVAIDENGDFYVTGSFSGSFDFDFSEVDQTLTSAGSWSGFVAKYNADRDLIWVNQFESAAGYHVVSSLVVDASMDVYLGGYVDTELAVNGSLVIENLSANRHGFLLKFNADGTYDWSGNLSQNSVVNDLEIDTQGNILAIGGFFGTCDFDFTPNELSEQVSNGSYDVFLSSYSSNGAYLESFSFGGAQYDEGHHVAVDSDGSVVITGEFLTQINCDYVLQTSGGGLFTAGATDGTFLAKYDSDLTFIWQKQIGNASDTFINDLEIGSNGDIWTIGIFEGTANFDTDGPFFDQNLTAQGFTDGFLSRLDTDGNYSFGGSITGSTGSEQGRAITIAPDGSLYLVGNYNVEIDLDFGNESPQLTTSAGIAGFIAKYNSFALSADGSDNPMDYLSIYPNPGIGMLTIEAKSDLSNTTVHVYDGLGRAVSAKTIGYGPKIQLQIEGDPGVYLVQLNWANGRTQTSRIVKL